METLSVVVPVYNAEKYLRQGIGSILAQTWTGFELILVDDGSVDRSPEICDTLAREDARIMVIHQPNSGALNARKTGLLEARGRWITFPDADDWMEPEYLEKMMDLLRRHGADIAAAGYTEEHENGDRFPRENRMASGVYCPDPESPLNREMLYCGRFYNAGVLPTLWSKVIRRDLLLDRFWFSGLDITNGDDAAWVYPALSRAGKVVVDNEIRLYHYRMVPGSLWQRYDPAYLQRVVNLVREMKVNLAEDRMMSDGLRYYALNMLRDGVNRYMENNFWKRPSRKAEEIRPALDALRGEIRPESLDWSGFDAGVLESSRVLAEGNGKAVVAMYARSLSYIKTGLLKTAYECRRKWRS